MNITFAEVQPHTRAYHDLVQAADQLDQAKYIAALVPHSDESLLLGAFDDEQCVGFLRLLIQVIGREYARSPIVVASAPLREGYVEAFGVLPAHRRCGIGQRLQALAIELCRERGCYQIRSRSPITSVENYALKLKLGYALQPSHENDSYYFIKTLS
ncbi:MAG: GNAT family N-acetyltransferase [Chloroflexi bacterium]|nr:GNAT family N-acetyltransferase [Chloroflexota bacterium]